jgi:ATP-dependent protease ClpP protease subunit
MDDFKINICGGIGNFDTSNKYISYLFEYEIEPEQNVVFNIDSLGGSFVDAIGIYNIIKSHKGKTKAVYNGLCASAATIIASGCDEIEMTEASAILVHKVLNFVDVFGFMNSDDLESVIAELQKVKSELDTLSLLAANLYAKRTGKDKDAVLELMKEDRWILVDEALELGFIDKVSRETKTVSLENRFDAARLVANVELPNLPTFENNKQQKNDTKMNEKLSLLDKATNFLASLLNIEKGEAETKAAELLNVLDIKKDAEKVTDFQNTVTAFETRLAVLETKLTNQVTLETIETKISDSKNVVDFDKLVNEATDKINTNLATALVDFEKDLTEKAATLHLELTNKIKESSDNGDFKAPKKVLTNTAYESLVNRFAPKN